MIVLFAETHTFVARDVRLFLTQFWYEKSFSAIKKACHLASFFVFLYAKMAVEVITRGVPEGTSGLVQWLAPVASG